MIELVNCPVNFERRKSKAHLVLTKKSGRIKLIELTNGTEILIDGSMSKAKLIQFLHTVLFSSEFDILT